MLKVECLTFSNIGRFVEPQTINFSSLGPLVQVDGRNMNTGGSSGAGKSTIFNALDYLFGLNSLPNSILQSRLTKSPIEVTGRFDFDGQELEIKRSKKGLTITLNDHVMGGSSKLSEEKLDQILGISRDLFRSMLHKHQKEGGFFLSLTPKEIYLFLTDCLNLSDLRRKAEKAHLASIDLMEKIEAKTLVTREASASLAATENALKALGVRPEVVADKPLFLKLKIDAEKAQEQYEKTRLVHQKEIELMERQRPAPVEIQVSGVDGQTLRSEHAEASAGLSRLKETEQRRQEGVRQKIAEQHALFAEASFLIRQQIDAQQAIKLAGEEARAKAQQIAKDIKHIRIHICYTCHQLWKTGLAETRERELLAEMAVLKSKIDAGMDAERKIESLNSQMSQTKVRRSEAEKELSSQLATPKNVLEIEEVLKKRLRDIEAEVLKEERRRREAVESANAENARRAKEFSARMANFASARNEELNSLGQTARKKQQELDHAVGALRAQEEAIKRYDRTKSELEAQRAQAAAVLASANEALAALQERLVYADEAKRAIKAYTSRLFDSALAAISDGATRIVRQIPNMQNATIELSATKETGEGKVKEEVNAVLHNEGEQNVPLRSLSGGERTSADIAVDLAAVQFLEDQAGKGIDLFILDEPFTGLDSANIEAVVEMLKTSASSKRIMIVDHNPIIAESFQSKIVVVREGTTSTLK